MLLSTKEARDMKTNEYVAQFLSQIGVARTYLLSGGMIAPLIDAIGEHRNLKLITVAHEQAAGFCADAEGRLTGIPGVALGTSGPGALNLVTALAACHYDSVPAIFIGGQVQTYVRRGSRLTRQFGLQECDFPTVTAPIAKMVVSPRNAREVPELLASAYVAAVSDRPGPVVVDIPFDVQIGETGCAQVVPAERPGVAVPTPESITFAADAIAAAQRPLVLAGGGVRCAGASAACRDLVRRFSLPLVTTVAALDVLPYDAPLRVGMPGTYGTRAANLTMDACDLLLVLGSRLDQGVLGADPAAFARQRTVVQIDIDADELGARIKSNHAMRADVGAALGQLITALEARGYRAPEQWIARIAEIAHAYSDVDERPPSEAIDPNRFFARLGQASGAAGTFCVDAGQHTWHCAQSLQLQHGQRFLSSTGLWAMGSAIPTAIGAALATGRPAVAVAGDGSVQLNIQELGTAVREELPLKVVVIDNGAHGMVRQFQSEFMQGRFHATVWNYRVPDLVRICEAYGLAARSMRHDAEVDAALAWLWSDPRRAQCLHVITDLNVNVSPSVSFGRQLRDMHPASPRQ
jgi:acetolactate synthase I/II/III large subunit